MTIEADVGVEFACPRCGKRCSRYDTRRRACRHFDTCPFKTLLVADVPRVECSEHAVVQVDVRWAEPGAGFTALMDALILDWLKEASIQAMPRLLRLSWDQVDGVMQRAVARGLKRREFSPIARLCIDETSLPKHHEYVQDADKKIAFDRFHVARAINDAVNTVRKQEHRELAAIDYPLLKGSRSLWITNSENHTSTPDSLFRFLKDIGLEIARA